MKNQTLYSRDSKGNILEWSIEVYPKVIPIVSLSHVVIHDNYDKIVIKEGLIDGVKTPTTILVKTGKNLGRMNESTPYEQAVSQSESRIEKKKKQGYKTIEDLGIEYFSELNMYQNKESYRKLTLIEILEVTLPKNRTDAEGNTKPMKAQSYFKDNGNVRIKFPCFAQPKLNGFRVICRWEKVLLEAGTVFEQEIYKPVFRSKEGLRYEILEHIEEELTELMFKWNINGKEIDLAFDGEMYIHGEILSEISSAVRKRNPKTPLLKFCIFDLAVEDLRQDERLRILEEMGYEFIKKNLNSVQTIFHSEIVSNEEAQTYTDNQIKVGYEGAIFRDKKATYQFGKRPMTMCKLKRSQDKEFQIFDVVGGENSPELGVFVCKAENGEIFKVTPEGAQELKKEYLLNKSKYIGKPVTVKFFERTKTGVPFHAVATTIRDYE